MLPLFANVFQRSLLNVPALRIGLILLLSGSYERSRTSLYACLVEAGGIEPPSANPPPLVLHA